MPKFASNNLWKEIKQYKYLHIHMYSQELVLVHWEAGESNIGTGVCFPQQDKSMIV